jgi:hypothetical protein
MKTIIDFTKRLLRLFYLSRFNRFANKKSPRLSEQQIYKLIENNPKDLYIKYTNK